MVTIKKQEDPATEQAVTDGDDKKSRDGSIELFGDAEQIKLLFESMADVGGEISSVTKGSTNPFFNSKYAPLDSILKNLKPVLAQYGLALIQIPLAPGVIQTVVSHKGGGYFKAKSYIPVPRNADAQKVGSAISYCRRYTVCALFSIQLDEDDDGNSVSNAKKQTNATVKKSQTVQQDVTELPF